MLSMTTDMTALTQTEVHADEDARLIAAFLDGDQGAFSTLVNKYRRQVYALARRYSGNHEEADDLTQETFVKAYRNLHGFRRESSFKTWLLRITTNLSINHVKSGRMTRDSGEPAEDHLGHSTADALGGMLRKERGARLAGAIAQLPPRQQQTLLLKTFRDMTCEEVARIMNCSVGTVKANVFHAVKRLKHLLTSATEEA